MTDGRPAHASSIGTARSPLDMARFGLALALLAAAFLLGATSGLIPIRAMIVELIALAAVCAALVDGRPAGLSRLAIAIVAVVMAVPLLQMIPLPPGVWMAMPGRQITAEIVRLLLPGLWRPISLDASVTFASWLYLLAPVAMFLLTVRLTERQRAALLALYVGLALVSVVLGLAQIAAPAFYLFPNAQPVRLPTGLFSNRNHQAAFMVSAAIAALMLARHAPFRDPYGKFLFPGLALVFAACVFGTASRAGMALLIVPLLYALVPLVRVRPTRLQFAIGVALIVAAFVALQFSSVVAQATGRFVNGASEGRFAFWPDVLFTARTYFPFGAGLGNFVAAYESVEALDTITRFTINRAHNEYLEIVIESGLAGIVEIGLVLFYIGHQGWRTTQAQGDRPTGRVAVAALLMIAVLALHSLVDFPLRTLAHLTAAGFLLGLLVPAPDAGQAPVPRRSGRRSRSSQRGIGA